MKTTVSVSDFRDAFRSIRPDNFSYEGLGLLFEYFEQFEQDCGEEIELDVIAICCDFAEDYTKNIASNYDLDIEGMDEEEIEDAVRSYLEDNGALVGEVAGGFVYRAF